MTPPLIEIIPECFNLLRDDAFIYNLCENIWAELTPEDLPMVAIDHHTYPDEVRRAAEVLLARTTQ